MVIYPNMVVPLFVGRDLSIKSLDDSMNNHDKSIVLVTQKSAEIDDPSIKDLYSIGTVANILQLLKLPDGTMKVLVEGVSRVKISKVETDSSLSSTFLHIPFFPLCYAWRRFPDIDQLDIFVGPQRTHRVILVLVSSGTLTKPTKSLPSSIHLY